MKAFVPVDIYGEEAEYIHVNPNVVAVIGIIPSEGSGAYTKEFPYTVEVTLINQEIIEFGMRTKNEAKAFVNKVGAII